MNSSGSKHVSPLDALDQASISHVTGYHMAMAYIPVKAAFAKYIGEPLGLRRVDFTILMLVRSNPGVTQKRISQFLAVSPPTVTVLLDRLVASGWILRERSQTDKRQQNIHLSTAGAGLAEKAFSVSLNYEAEMLRHLTHGEQAMLRELLVKVARNRKV